MAASSATRGGPFEAAAPDRSAGEQHAIAILDQSEGQRWPGESGQPDKWDFCLTRAKMAVEQER